MEWFYKCGSLDLKRQSPEDVWEYEEEPHSDRRKKILKKYPEMKKLMGYDPFTAYMVSVTVVAQFAVAWLVRDISWSNILLLSYFLGAVMNHSLGTAVHEIGHNLAFGHKRASWNRILGIWCNFPIIVPMAVSYKKYHQEHHRYLGEENKDVDIPTRIESYLFRNPVTKIIWLMIHPLVHAIRPFYKNPQPLTGWEITNAICQIVFDLLVLKVLGVKSLMYLFTGTYFAFGIHPLAAHFISEHYLFNGGQATHSYYGPLNFIMYNVGYHIEHHDFPYIPFRKLPEVSKIAPEFYDNIPYHTSWFKVMWDFIFDKNMGPHARGVGFLKEDYLKDQDKKSR